MGFDCLFFMAAIMSLGFLLIHTCSMVVAFNGFAEGKKTDKLFAPMVHLIAAMTVSIYFSFKLLKHHEIYFL